MTVISLSQGCVLRLLLRMPKPTTVHAGWVQLQKVDLLDIGSIGILEAVLALDNTRHGREVLASSISVIEHFFFDFN